MKAIELKLKYGPKAFYEAIKIAFGSGHKVCTFKGACNYAEWVLNSI